MHVGLPTGDGAISWLGNGYDQAFDNNTDTYFAATFPNSYCKADYGALHVITGIKYYPQAKKPERMIGGKFYCSPSSEGPWTTLYTILQTPTVSWHPVDIANVTGGTYSMDKNTIECRYVKYQGPANGYSNIAGQSPSGSR